MQRGGQVFLAQMVGDIDGNGPVIGAFETMDEAKACCEATEAKLCKTLPVTDQAEFARIRGVSPMQWTKLHDDMYELVPMPPLFHSTVNGPVSFKARKRLGP